MRSVSFTVDSLGNVIVGIRHLLLPRLSQRQQRVHGASRVGLHMTEGGGSLGSRQVLALQRQSREHIRAVTMTDEYNGDRWHLSLYSASFRKNSSGCESAK